MKTLLFVLGAAFAVGQSARVEGKVVSVAGSALSKATVRLANGDLRENRIETTSDGDGKFVFGSVAPGRYTLSALKPGFLTQVYGAASATGRRVVAGSVLTLAPGTVLKDLVLKMAPQSVISGRVTDQDGEAVAKAEITLMDYRYRPTGKALGMVSVRSTDDQGNYRIPDVLPGRYYIVVLDRSQQMRAELGERPGRAVPEVNIATYYPNATNAAEGTPLEVMEGSDLRGIDVRLRRAKVYSVKGKAVDASTGFPLAAQRLALVPKGVDENSLSAIPNSDYTQTQPDGTFEFRNLQSGTFEFLYIRSASPSATSLATDLGLTVAASDIEGLVARFSPVAPINGIVAADEPGKNLGKLFLSLIPFGNVRAPAAQIEIGADGTFQTREAGAAKYTWSITGLPEGMYVKSIRFGSEDVTHEPIDNTSGAGGTLEFRLSFKAANLAGSVRNDKGEPLGGMVIRAWPKVANLGMTGGGLTGAATDQDGRFSLASVPPGEYYVGAFEELETGMARSPEFLARFTDVASVVKLEQRESATVEVKLIPADRVATEIARLP